MTDLMKLSKLELLKELRGRMKTVEVPPELNSNEYFAYDRARERMMDLLDDMSEELSKGYVN